MNKKTKLTKEFQAFMRKNNPADTSLCLRIQHVYWSKGAKAAYEFLHKTTIKDLSDEIQRLEEQIYKLKSDKES